MAAAYALAEASMEQGWWCVVSLLFLGVLVMGLPRGTSVNLLQSLLHSDLCVRSGRACFSIVPSVRYLAKACVGCVEEARKQCSIQLGSS
jgi:RsiW-degrading membrane proteinase PrsW (M82 family)